jgi:hypothetical protein
LHRLERRTGAPRKARTKARALTVMRLEERGGGSGTETRNPRLPRDVQDQIDVIRGRAAGKPSRGLLQLEERLLCRSATPPAQIIQRHEHSATPMPAAGVSNARAQAASIASGVASGSYSVEPFEDTSSTLPGAGNDWPSGAPALIMPQGTAAYAAPAPATSPGSLLTAPSDRQVLPVAELDRNISAGAGSLALADTERRAHERALTGDQLAVASNFDRDIAAMLGSAAPAAAPEDSQWNNAMLDATKPKTPPANVAAVETPQSPTAPQGDAHEVFNQMGLAMNYANSFDLGAMDMSQRFDRFEQELALAPNAPPPVSTRVPVHAFALDDFDVVADLAEISGAQSAPAGEVPSNPPTTNPEPATTEN